MRIQILGPFLTICALLALTSQVGSGASSASDIILEPVISGAQEVSIENESALTVTGRAVDTDVLEVTAVSTTHSLSNALTMKFLLRDGSATTFAMPDHPERNYVFANREGRVVVIAAEIAFIEIAQIN